MDSARPVTVPVFEPATRDDVATYHAGILDAEGSLALSRDGSLEYIVEQVGRDWLVRLYADVGLGNVTASKRRRRNRKHQAAHRWRIGKAEDIKAYLSWVLPYVRKKNREVELVFAYLNGTISLGTARRRIQHVRQSYARN